MPFLTIHGFEIECAKCERRPILVGQDSRRSPTGALRLSRVAEKIELACETPIMDPSVIAPIVHLMHGRGHVWSFDADSYSSKGLAFSIPSSLDTTNKKFGTSAMSAASGSTYTTSTVTDNVRTILLWRRPGSSSFNHYALVCTGATVTSKFKNGVTTAETVTNWFTPSSDGNFALLGKNDAGTNTLVQYDDVVVLPFAATQAMITAWAAATTAWADLPMLNVGGDAVTPDTTIVAIPEPGRIANTRGVSPTTGTFKTLQAFAFSLEQV